MKRFVLLVVIIILAACATNPLDQKRKAILDCIKDLKINDTDTMDAFEICSKLYKLNVEKSNRDSK